MYSVLRYFHLALGLFCEARVVLVDTGVYFCGGVKKSAYRFILMLATYLHIFTSEYHGRERSSSVL